MEAKGREMNRAEAHTHEAHTYWKKKARKQTIAATGKRAWRDARERELSKAPSSSYLEREGAAGISSYERRRRWGGITAEICISS